MDIIIIITYFQIDLKPIRKILMKPFENNLAKYKSSFLQNLLTLKNFSAKNFWINQISQNQREMNWIAI